MPSAGWSEMPAWADGARSRTGPHLSAAEQAVPCCDIGSRKDKSIKTLGLCSLFIVTRVFSEGRLS